VESLFSDFFIAKKIAAESLTRQLAGNAPNNIFNLAFLQLKQQTAHIIATWSADGRREFFVVCIKNIVDSERD